MYFFVGLEELVHIGKLPIDALQSAVVVRKINMAFDLLNSSSFLSGPKCVIQSHLLDSKLAVSSCHKTID